MKDLKQIAGEKPQNPANKLQITVGDKSYVPMSVPQQKLWAPEIPGWHCHWMRGTRQRIAQAFQGGYQFVSEEEFAEYGGFSFNFDLGGDAAKATSTDMGTRVSVVSGAEEVGDQINSSAPSQAERLYLMKCPEEVWRKSQGIIEARNESIAEAIRGGTVGSDKDDQPNRRYGGQQAEPQVGIRKAAPQHLFVKKH